MAFQLYPTIEFKSHKVSFGMNSNAAIWYNKFSNFNRIFLKKCYEMFKYRKNKITGFRNI